ncbi:hypothetical protein ATE47_03690 [Chryseobacterium sp. IHB B 17019]|jgi:hypothetical protein|uniref:hypothetical protein n=1 Tax=Chryseobacterium sp. IHB B 17019 TaxID=1721091 RepID=UPI00071F8723|nr:hypothetical protein [Chryseobacterium sp. IHB B 17019]ALR29681.1 hypothetical protein ATE47_03690 [Chryseobacterium sp. IHB B 17019]
MTKKIIIIALTSSVGVYSQVGINTTNPKGVLDIVSTNSTMVIPRLPNPNIIAAPVEGMLVYDSTNKTIRYFDGVNWSTLMYSKEQTKSNEGVVKISGGGGTLPTWTNVPANTTKQVMYSTPLSYASSPTTSWPDNSPPSDAKIFKNNQFIENAVMGQVHQWRIIINYTKGSNASSQDIRFILRNPSSGFRSEASAVIPSNKTSGVLVYNFTTIADGASLPPPLGTGGGYIIEWVSSDPVALLSIDSVTRISSQKN